MIAMRHGRSTATIEQVEARFQAVAEAAAATGLPFQPVVVPRLHRYGLLFPSLATAASQLPAGASTLEGLRALGQTMRDPTPELPAGDSAIPSAYTYFGQFVDHDVTLEVRSDTLAKLDDPNLAPIPVAKLNAVLRNGRTGTLDLDNVYADPAPRDGDRMRLGKVTTVGGRPPGKDDDNDVPRRAPDADPAKDREALIGDARNDENLVVSQLQVAFLRAHNALVDEGLSFRRAQRRLRRHYQWVVVHDYLPRIADPAVVSAVVAGNQVFDPAPGKLFVPLEFTAAAYRFGHSMIRARYHHNDISFPDAGLELLFTFTALSGNMAGLPTLPDNWIIEWQHFVGASATPNMARLVDTNLTEPLFHLPDSTGAPMAGLAAMLATRNLLRGYMLGLPTGQAVAQELGLTRLTPAELAAAVPAAQAAVLQTFGFDQRTPLWYYVLAEAKASGTGRLGPVGSRLVAEVLVGLVRRSKDSFLEIPGWTPSLPSATPGTFELADLLRLGGVLT